MEVSTPTGHVTGGGVCRCEGRRRSGQEGLNAGPVGRWVGGGAPHDSINHF